MDLATQSVVLPYIFDLEMSGKCNTVCTFCPRDEMKRGEQFMSELHFEHFLKNLGRYVSALEDRQVNLPYEKTSGKFGKRELSAARVTLCGMGESLMHPKCPEWIQRIRQEVGVRVTVVAALGDYGKPGVVVELARVEKDAGMKKEIVRRLSNMRSKEAQAYLVELLQE